MNSQYSHKHKHCRLQFCGCDFADVYCVHISGAKERSALPMTDKTIHTEITSTEKLVVLAILTGFALYVENVDLSTKLSVENMVHYLNSDSEKIAEYLALLQE